MTGGGHQRGHGSDGQVVLTGGPELADRGPTRRVPDPGRRSGHQVAVTEPHPAFAPVRLPMVFDLPAGLYWRPEEGGLLFGMSNPDEPPGEATEIDWPYHETMRARLARLVPVTRALELRKVWAATIDYTPDHLPDPRSCARQDGPVAGVTVASAGGHGMMWGPGVARAAADLALTEPPTSSTCRSRPRPLRRARPQPPRPRPDRITVSRKDASYR